MQSLQKNLLKGINPEKPVLLAFSGGSDSMALYCYLLERKQKSPLNLHLVHVDHKIRKSSSSEAIRLQKFAAENNTPFHLFELEINCDKNLEKKLRELRYQAIKSCYDKIGAQALLIAHHRDDLVETTLKRVLEGSYITHFQGMKKTSQIYGMKVLRPLLDTSKEVLKKYLVRKKQFWIEDDSNFDQKFQRANMRHEILPYLSETFEKKINENILALSSYAKNLEDYLERKTRPFRQKLIDGPFGICFDGQELDLHVIECEYMIRKILKTYQKELSRDQIQKASFSYLMGEAHKKFSKKGLILIVDRKRLFFVFDEPKKYEPLKKPLEMKKIPNVSKEISWVDLWQGVAYYPAAKGTLKLEPIQKSSKKNQEYFSKKNVPVFLRDVYPSINAKLPLQVHLENLHEPLLVVSYEKK